MMVGRFQMKHEHDWICARPDGKGDWVRYSDYEAFAIHAAGKATALERQIAELRAQRDEARVSGHDSFKLACMWQDQAKTAEAENARLRALPLKDEVERAFDNLLVAYAACNGEDHPAYVAARVLLSRLRAGVQEGWQQCGWAYQDRQWDEDRWHVCGMDSKPREHDGRLVQPIYVAASPSLSEGGSRG